MLTLSILRPVLSISASLALAGLCACASSETGGMGGSGASGGTGGDGGATTATTGGMTTGGMTTGGMTTGGGGGMGGGGMGGLGGGGMGGGGMGGLGGMGGMGGGGMGGMPTTGAGGSCQTCSEFAVDPAPIQSNLCDDNGVPSSLDIWQDLRACICTTACPAECATSLCDDAVLTPNAACQTCLDDQASIIAACPTEANACLGD